MSPSGPLPKGTERWICRSMWLASAVLLWPDGVNIVRVSVSTLHDTGWKAATQSAERIMDWKRLWVIMFVSDSSSMLSIRQVKVS